ncbi:hypothetical protein DEO72_LG6g2772 [Vigna unguiculata]|uniref:Protein BIC1 n=1 Tax=Vigna unguiculata TaxID=3917 RepID=A0A4D6MDD3_VIGUN|nr:hypothetical protein DEO72_LG6g2772 [Vigna unguiculata]
MAHRSSAESHHQIPSNPLDLNTTQDIINNMEEQKQQQQQNPLFSLSEVSHDGIDRDKGVTEEDPSASKSILCEEEKMALQEGLEEDSGRERLKRHRVEVAGRVWIPDMWGQEELLKDWIDCAAFDAPLVTTRISTAREALVEECTRANAAGLRIENRC